jgi:hypothetical protein
MFGFNGQNTGQKSLGLGVWSLGFEVQVELSSRSEAKGPAT